MEMVKSGSRRGLHADTRKRYRSSLNAHMISIGKTDEMAQKYIVQEGRLIILLVVCIFAQRLINTLLLRRPPTQPAMSSRGHSRAG